MRALDDKELVKKLLALDLKETTAKMLEVCCNHIAIPDNLDAMGLSGPKSVSAVKQQGKQHHQGHKQSNGNQHQCGNCTKSYPLGQASCLAKDATCNKCGKVGHWKPRCCGGLPKKSPKKPPKKGKGRGQKIDNVGTDLHHHFDEIDVASISTDPEHIQISNIHIDAMTEAYTTVQMPAQIGSNKQASLRCKVDTGTGGNVMPLCAFSKLFPRCVTTDGTPKGLRPTGLT